MKMAESSGVTITERAAKAMVRKYGKGKDYLSLEDCLRLNERWGARQSGKGGSRERR